MNTEHQLHDFLTHNEPALNQAGTHRWRWGKVLLIILALVLLLGATWVILSFF